MSQQKPHTPRFNLGFRAFFSRACVFAAMAIAYWLTVYLGFVRPPVEGPMPLQ